MTYDTMGPIDDEVLDTIKQVVRTHRLVDQIYVDVDDGERQPTYRPALGNSITVLDLRYGKNDSHVESKRLRSGLSEIYGWSTIAVDHGSAVCQI